MKKFEKIYQELSKKFTDEEIAEAMLIPQDLTEKEKEAANEEMRRIRLKLLSEQTEEQRIFSDLLRFKYQLEDYLKKGVFNEEKTFGNYLNEYVRILKKTKKELANDLSTHYTRMSRIFNDKEDPNVELTYRLERHSGKLIPAVLWWKILIKKQEFEIKKNQESREQEWSKVRNALEIRA